MVVKIILTVRKRMKAFSFSAKSLYSVGFIGKGEKSYKSQDQITCYRRYFHVIYIQNITLFSPIITDNADSNQTILGLSFLSNLHMGVRNRISHTKITIFTYIHRNNM